jgi:hypothetical protein
VGGKVEATAVLYRAFYFLTHTSSADPRLSIRSSSVDPRLGFFARALSRPTSLLFAPPQTHLLKRISSNAGRVPRSLPPPHDPRPTRARPYRPVPPLPHTSQADPEGAQRILRTQESAACMAVGRFAQGTAGPARAWRQGALRRGRQARRGRGGRALCVGGYGLRTAGPGALVPLGGPKGRRFWIWIWIWIWGDLGDDSRFFALLGSAPQELNTVRPEAKLT